jgi:hypothetical protein
MIINELYKVAYVHLSLLGYSEEDIADFEINLFNPSQIATLQKIEVLSAKLEVAEKMKAFYSDDYIYEEIFEMTYDEIKKERMRRLNQKKFDMLGNVLDNIKIEDIANDLSKITDFKFDYNAFFGDVDKLESKEQKQNDATRQKKILKGVENKDVASDVPKKLDTTKEDLKDINELPESKSKDKIFKKLLSETTKKVRIKDTDTKEEKDVDIAISQGIFEDTNKSVIIKNIREEIDKKFK